MSSHEVSVKKGVNIENASIIWMVIEAAVAIGSGEQSQEVPLIPTVRLNWRFNIYEF